MLGANEDVSALAELRVLSTARHAALRRLALKRHVRETHAGPVWNGGSCSLCRTEWAEPFEGNEYHKEGCLAAPGEKSA